MVKGLLIRFYKEPKQTLGQLYFFRDGKEIFTCRTIELPWKGNARRVSSIPVGEYYIKKDWSPRFKQDLWEFVNVPDRSEIKFHVANYVRQLQGCIGVGDMWTDLDADGLRDVRSSRKTLDRMHLSLEGESVVRIKIIDL